ncbi:alpha/beta hydrolase [Glycomyces sp. NPDC047010]|uniref:alpha/beta hydrolase n=1 Tax=Glycomyces sp. NPDC047010 TaxID=3155023 RepID=UPI0033F1B441
MAIPDLDELRADITARQGRRARGPELPHVEDLTGPGGLRLRRYGHGEPRPVVVFVHGGAWVICDLDTHDRTCRRIAAECGVEVLAVDYRLAPEHPNPAGIEDVAAVLHWARPWAVAGDSAGGFLAAMACIRLRDNGEPVPDVQILLCPNTDLTLSQPSVEEKGTGFGLDADFLAWAAAQWEPDPGRRADPANSPMLVPDLRGLPRAVIVTAEDDALRDEGRVFADRLREAGNDVVYRCEPGLVHGFIQGMDLTSPEAAAAHERVFADIRALR